MYQALSKVSIIGTGQVAYHLVRRLFTLGYSIQWIYGRDLEKAHNLAQQVKAKACCQYDVFAQNDEHLIIIAVSDSAISDVMQQLSVYIQHQLVVHTSGSTDMQVLQRYYSRVGVLYPLQTFSMVRDIDWLHTPLLWETAQKDDEQKLQSVAQSLSEKVYHYSSQQRFSLHLSAVIACNFSNLCYDLAKQIMDLQGVDYKLLAPLIQETTQKALQFNPHDVQTGPAKRGDVMILQRHQQMLKDLQRDDIAQLYTLMSDMIRH